MLANAQKNFANAQKDDALNRLIELAKNDCLKQSYRNARINIQMQYKSQELNRFYRPSQENQLIKLYDIENIAIAIPPDPLIAIAIAVFKAPDSSAEAKKYKSEIIPIKI